MIDSRDEIIELLKEYTVTQYEHVYQFWMPGAAKWSVKRQVDYNNGIVLGKFRENDSATMQILKEGVTDKALYSEIRVSLEHQIKSIEDLEQPDIMQQMCLVSYRRQQDELLSCSIDEWISKNCGWIKRDVEGRPYSEVKTLLYLYYSFENYEYQRQNPFCSDLNELQAVYEDILGKQSQFNKYGIVPVDNERELLLIDPPRIYDISINKTFFTKNVPLTLLKKIAEMISCGAVKGFSVRLRNEPGYNGKMYCEYIAEALERGKVFDFVNLKDFSISKLYSQKYENCMWVVIDPPNITFEELCQDFCVYEDMVVTQVVHLQYKKESDDAYITHLDHEYVFYTLEEYENRMRDITQKGNAKKRLKSFKIDNSKIPFDFRCKILRKDEDGNDLPQEYEQFLCYVLECYFKHKDLLKEYFEKV